MSSSNFLLRIKQGAANTVQVRWPGREELVTMRVASKQDLADAHFAAEARFKSRDVLVMGHNHLDFTDEKNVQTLYRVLSVDGKPVTTSVDSFRALITQDELDVLSDAYVEFERENSPNFDHLTDDQVADLMAELKKKPDEIIGSVSSIAIARRLLRTMAAQLPS